MKQLLTRLCGWAHLRTPWVALKSQAARLALWGLLAPLVLAGLAGLSTPALAQASDGAASTPAAAAPATPAAATQAPLEVFVREGCPHCAKAEQFLAVLARERPELRIVIRDVLKEPAALQRLQVIASEQKVGTARVPAFFVGG